MPTLGIYSVLSPNITDLAIRQNGYGAQNEPLGLQPEIVYHWLAENGIDDWSDTTKKILFEINYNSHNWQLVRDPGSPYQSPEHMRVCKDCGLEDMGHPDEFNIEYPNCANVGD